MRAAETVADQKVAFVERHRKRLARDTGEAVAQARDEYLALVDRLAEVRQELRELRRSEIWAHLYPDELVGREAPDSLAGAQRRPLTAMGLNAPVQVGPVLDALRADASWVADAAAPEQRARLLGIDPRRPPNTFWAGSPEHQRWVREQTERARRRKEWGGDPPGGLAREPTTPRR